jgi:hypothetical protein
LLKRHQNGIAANVPTVPGALFTSPLPNPKASSKVGE